MKNSSKKVKKKSFSKKSLVENEVSFDEVLIEDSQEIVERDYSKMDLVDLIDQPAWKTILIDLVESEKMDPWNIDVIILCEKYLKKISELEGNNLRVPANAILACAILVKTKSKYLKISSLQEEDEKVELTQEQKDLMLATIPDLMSERMSREGRITLDELVMSIEDIIQRTNPKKNSSRNVPKIEINFDSISIEEKLDGVFDLIKQKVDSQGIVLFKDLVDSDEVDGLVDIFLPILFLMNSGKVVAYQNEFFGEIFVQLIQKIPIEEISYTKNALVN
ncbi:MAG: segregation/condensation protein A [Candidatus ainarchaeum sp.]|jgi:segregation and condensation protein A|nr:segregation/condensation protein A [Candidatus ainarchaeum sp.]MDD3085627.1 segregation/condensation protein A [Candidatus ainarchaeum sp.]MDD4128415.1 segregation/condensation protein A [Candidatus ainarchaeum sp.]MDD4467684.1 segregation/condensation protein A [Candidatus ainarchaeum sp.]HPM85488.1 segregation/condensation protein A [archaeon]